MTQKYFKHNVTCIQNSLCFNSSKICNGVLLSAFTESFESDLGNCSLFGSSGSIVGFIIEFVSISPIHSPQSWKLSEPFVLHRGPYRKV